MAEGSDRGNRDTTGALPDGREIITGDMFGGRFARLRDVWLDPGPVFDEVEVGRFAGREWLLRRIDRFIDRHDRGYVVVQGPAGIGKTMLAAHLAETRGWPCHFTRRAKGRIAQTALRNLAAQLIAGYRLSDRFAPGGVLPEAAGEPGWFEQVVRAAASIAHDHGHKLVILVDGLDEAETFDGDLPLGLPVRPPRGAIFVVTCRSGSPLLGLRLPWERTTINLTDPKNLADMRLFLDETVETDPLIRDALGNADGDAFVSGLMDRCGGVWVLLRYILDEVRLGLRDPGALDRIPTDLASYYQKALGPRPAAPDDSARLRLLATLAAATEPLPLRVLGAMADIDSLSVVERLCGEVLRPFLTATAGADGLSRYGIYHVSLREFLHGGAGRDNWQAEMLASRCQAAHGRIVELYLSAFGGLAAGLPVLAGDPAAGGMHDGYPLRNLAHHLERQKRFADLHTLLVAESGSVNVWWAAHDRAGTISDYLSDLARAARAAVRQTDTALAAGQTTTGLGRELRYAVMAGAVRSLANSIPAELVEALVRHGMWSARRAVAHSRNLLHDIDRVDILTRVAALTSEDERAEVLREALGLGRRTHDPGHPPTGFSPSPARSRPEITVSGRLRRSVTSYPKPSDRR
ncbi:ATP-binding protein [Catenuloplanes japonicus]|uniref:ATP-binding protein n=1 Tax=Catenuloplanes japonicus TaxID=33876 RepID=UPI000A9CC3E8|nr:ATP-binding protein [Catenuloplanes japonicus]